MAARFRPHAPSCYTHKLPPGKAPPRGIRSPSCNICRQSNEISKATILRQMGTSALGHAIATGSPQSNTLRKGSTLRK
jgi:hypothetical protein